MIDVTELNTSFWRLSSLNNDNYKVARSYMATAGCNSKPITLSELTYLQNYISLTKIEISQFRLMICNMKSLIGTVYIV